MNLQFDDVLEVRKKVLKTLENIVKRSLYQNEHQP